MGMVWRGPSPKIQVTPSARPSSWHEPQELQASSDCLPRKSRGMMSRTAHADEAVVRYPERREEHQLPKHARMVERARFRRRAGGDVLGKDGVFFEVEHRNRHVDLVVDEAQLALVIHHNAGRDVARLEADDVVRGADVELAVRPELGLEHVVAAAADDEEVLAVGVRVHRHDVVAEQPREVRCTGSGAGSRSICSFRLTVRSSRSVREAISTTCTRAWTLVSRLTPPPRAARAAHRHSADRAGHRRRAPS